MKGALSSRLVQVTALVIVVLAAVGLAVGFADGSSSGEKHLTAYFNQTIGLYQGNAVDIMGVQVGTIDSLTNVGDRVKAEITYDGQYKLPSKVKAVIIAPAVVSDRYVQLQPVYHSGPVLADDATLGVKQTAVPLEFDDIFRNVDTLDKALGSHGANSNGALSRLISVGAKNLRGNGKRIHDALDRFSAAIATVSGNRGNLFSTISHLQRFTSAIAHDDGGVRALNANLARVGTQLDSERKDLGTALSNLSSALQTVDQFVAANRGELTSDIHGLTKVSADLQAEKKAIISVVDGAGPAVTNLALAGDPEAGTLDTVADLTEPLTSPGKLKQTLCQALEGNSLLGTVLGITQLCGPGSGSSLPTTTLGGQRKGGISALLDPATSTGAAGTAGRGRSSR